MTYRFPISPWRYCCYLLAAFTFLATEIARAQPPAISFHTVTEKIPDWSRAASIDVARLAYESTPWLTDEDIRAWDVGSGRVLLNGDRDEILGRFDPSLAGGGFLGQLIKAFVILVDGEPCQLAACVSPLSSMIPPVLSFHTLRARTESADMIVLRSYRRDSEPVAACLTERLLTLDRWRGGNLHIAVEGLAVTAVEYPPALEVTCYLVLTNDGPDDILVLDPDLIRPDFGGYRAGLALESVASRADRTRQDVRPPVWGAGFAEDWLVRLPAGGQLRGSFVTGTRRLVGGEYAVQVTYPGVRTIPADQRTIDDAWMWPWIVAAADTVLPIPAFPGARYHARLHPSQVLYLQGERVEVVDMVTRPDGALVVNNAVFTEEGTHAGDLPTLESAIRELCNGPTGGVRVLVITRYGEPIRVRFSQGAEAVRQILAARRDGTITRGPLPASCLREFLP